jgi:hypothetical protein
MRFETFIGLCLLLVIHSDTSPILKLSFGASTRIFLYTRYNLKYRFSPEYKKYHVRIKLFESLRKCHSGMVN